MNSSERLEFDKVLQRMSQYASFSLGKEAVLQSQPSYSKIIVERDLGRLQESIDWITSNDSLHFGGISDVSHVADYAAKAGVLTPMEIVTVNHFLQGALRLQKQFTKGEGTYKHLPDLFESLLIDTTLLQELERCFGDQGYILDRASSELQSIRSQLQQLEKSIDEKTQAFLLKNKALLSEQIITYQQGRRMFLIKPSDKNKLEGHIYGNSASGQSVYFEPAFLAQLQNETQNLRGAEHDEEERICTQISGQIGKQTEQIQANLETLALIDGLFAKAEWGLANQACVATLSKDELQLVAARHPLIDPQQVVPNTYTLKPPYRMILISGPNTGGKSVSLKTMGLAIMMSLSGCPVCCDEATVMLVDAIFVDIGDQQSIEKSLSSFSAHIETITEVVHHATSRSLVLLDELGSQTDPLEGESLSMAILDYFRKVGCWVIATTHFSRLKQYGTEHDDILMASVAFDLENLQPTYQYQEHILGESNAFAIAKRLRLRDDIIDAAFKYKQASQYEADHLLEILEARIQETEALKKELQAHEVHLQDQDQALLAQREAMSVELQQQKQTYQEQYDARLEALVNQAQVQLDIINKSQRPDFRQKALTDLQALEHQVPLTQELAVGDRVRIQSTQQVGTIDALEKQQAFISVGGLRMKVALKNLEKVAGPPQNVKPERSHSVQTRSRVNLECNVVGMRVAEALPIVEKYIDDCVVQKVPFCRIVHGHGTGTLRKAIQEQLRHNKHVASFELAPVNEGGSGVTVVTLKS